MATKSKKGGDVIQITGDDFKGRKFKTAPAGKYRVRISPKSKIKPGKNGNILNLMVTITAASGGSKTEHKGINIFDNLAPHVGWKIAQLLKAIGVKKAPKKMTLQQLLAMLKKYGKEIRVILIVDRYNGQKQNKIQQYLPLTATKDEDEDDIDDESESSSDDDEDEDSGEDSDEDSEGEDEDEDEEDSDEDEEDSDEDEDDDDSDDEDSDDEDEDSEDEDDDDESDEDEDDEDEDSDDEDEEDSDDEDEDEEDEDEDEEEGEKPTRRGKAKSKPKAKRPAKKVTKRRGRK